MLGKNMSPWGDDIAINIIELGAKIIANFNQASKICSRKNSIMKDIIKIGTAKNINNVDRMS